jgi:DNA-binding winged helix-turn-helix (wHTH) protein
MSPPVRYRFGAFVLSPRGRTLTRDGQPVPLIPKYFDVLHLLVERRADAVAKAEIFAAVWSDVIVTDGALAQAVRTLRRALDDDSREPRYIRTVSRHGYQFVAAGVVEEPDTGSAAPVVTVTPGATATTADVIAAEVDRLIAAAAAQAGADAREAAGRLHAIGTAAAVAALRARPGHARALAYLRDARWDDPTAGGVPLAGDPERTRAAFEVVRLRLSEGAPLVAARSRAGALAGAVVGAVAGCCGGVALTLAPGSSATAAAPLALAVIGAAAGAVGVSAVAAGVAAAELAARSQRSLAVVAAASAASLVAGMAAHLVVRTLLEGLFAIVYVTIPGPMEGLALGAAVSLAYVAATWTTAGGGLPAPAGGRRIAVVAATSAGGAVAGVVLGALGWPLVGGIIHQIARLSGDAPLGLAPLARLIGEPAFGPLTQRLLAGFEGAMFGLAAGIALTRRR